MKRMYRNVWKYCHSSICSIDFYNYPGIRVMSLSGFKVKDYLITDDFIFTIPNVERVVLRFVGIDGISVKTSIELSYREFVAKSLFIDEKDAKGFAILNIDLPEFKVKPSLILAKQRSFEVGQPISMLGFQQEQQNLTIKSGILSSFFVHPNGKKYVQFDTTVDRGNSGSPLIDPETNEVIGIVAHKLSKVTQSFNQMMRIINDNIRSLKEAEGQMNVDQIDPIQVLIATQNQIKHITKELYRSATMGLGHAFEIDQVLNYFAEDYDIEKVRVKI